MKYRRFHLFGEQFLVNQAVENSSPIIFREFVERAAVQQGLVAQGFVPIALQNNVPIHGGDDAVDYLPGVRHGKDARTPYEKERDRRNRLRANPTHQNGWPMLKNTLKCRRRWVS